MTKTTSCLLLLLCALTPASVFAIDTDNDFSSDSEEALAGTDPVDPAQRPYWLETINLASSFSTFSESIDYIGDVNGDGYHDFIAGASEDTLQAIKKGSVTVFSGKDRSKLFEIYGTEDNGQFGKIVSEAGDVNADGTPDFMVASEKTVSVFSGKDAALLTVFNDSLGLNQFGSGISAAGDVNQDGVDDIVLAANTSGVIGSEIIFFAGGDFTVIRKKSFSSWVSRIVKAGDLNSDGTTDFFVAESGNDTISFVSGIDGTIINTIDSLDIEERTPLAGDGDINKDGFNDLIVGDPSNSSRSHMNGNDPLNGKAYIFSGKDGTLLKEFYGSGYSTFGSSVSYVADLDQDGFIDIAIGAKGADSVRIFSGKDFKEIYYLSGFDLNAGFGFAMADDDLSGLVVGDTQSIRVIFHQDLKHDKNLDFVIDGLSPVSQVNFPPLPDEDEDGLDNEKEKVLGTDPYTLDSDYDGFSDAVDYFPLNSDIYKDNNSDGKDDIPSSYSFRLVYRGTLWDSSADCEMIISSPPDHILIGKPYSFNLNSWASDSGCTSGDLVHIYSSSFIFGPFDKVGQQYISTATACGGGFFGGTCAGTAPLYINVGSSDLSFATKDSDFDGVFDINDDLPLDPSGSVDSDRDGIGDSNDEFPFNPSESVDTDGDGVGDNSDVFPNDASESVDTDGDGIGDNSDVFPNDASESVDTDGDGVGDNSDAFPNDAAETVDSDGDGVGDNSDVFPNDASESVDTDGDGVGDNSDAFPNDAAETVDSDGDGVGDNADAYPFNSQLSELKTGRSGGGPLPLNLLLLVSAMAVFRSVKRWK